MIDWSLTPGENSIFTTTPATVPEALPEPAKKVTSPTLPKPAEADDFDDDDVDALEAFAASEADGFPEESKPDTNGDKKASSEEKEEKEKEPVTNGDKPEEKEAEDASEKSS